MDYLDDAYQIIAEKIGNWVDQVVSMLPNFVIAVLILILFYLAARLLASLVSKTLTRFSRNVALIKLMVSLTRIIIMTTALFIALGVLELEKTVTSLLAGVGIIGLAIGFAFKDTIANFLSGIYITLKSTVNIGDIVQFGDYYGKVSSIGLRAVKMKTFQGQEVVIPNRLIFEDTYTHFTIYRERRIDLNVGISYGEDLQRVEDITLSAIKSIDYLQKNKPIDLYYQEFGDSSINFVVRYWITFEKQTDYLRALSDGIKRIKSTYDKNNITIPFPIRTLDFGIKGGKTLDEVQMNMGYENRK